MAEAGDMSKNQNSESLRLKSNGGKKIEAGILLEHEAASENSKGRQDAETTEGGGGGGGIFLRGRMSFRSFHGKPSRRRGNWDEEMMYTMRGDQPVLMDETMSARHNNASAAAGLEKMESPPLPSDGAFDTADNDSDESDTDTESEAMRDFYRNIALSQERNAALINELNDDPDDFVDRFLRFRGQGDIIDMLMWDLQLDGDESNSQTTYPIGELRTTEECLICFNITSLNLRPCCAFPVCNSCLETYFHTQVSEAIVKIACPNTDCAQKVHRDEILARLNVTMKVKFNQFLVDANKEPHRKTCPRCSSIMTIDLQLLREPIAKKFGVQVGCVDCGLDWCFPCQAPWHEAMKCKEYRRGDKLVKAWALERPHGQFNAQKCPKCKVFIQRSTGCDHMTCSQCNTHFCYQCGEKFREFKFIGNHYSRLSIFGCKYLYDKEKPIERKFVRGSIFGAKLLAAPILGGLALGAGAVVAGIGLVVLPFYGGYKLHKKLQQTRQMKRHRAELLNYRLRTPYPEWEPNRPQSFPNIVITEHMSTNEESNLSAAAAAAAAAAAVGVVPSNQDPHKDEIDKLDRSFFHAAKADSLMCCGANVVANDVDQSSVNVANDVDESSVNVANDVDESSVNVGNDVDESSVNVGNDVDESSVNVANDVDESSVNVANDGDESSVNVANDVDESSVNVANDESSLVGVASSDASITGRQVVMAMAGDDYPSVVSSKSPDDQSTIEAYFRLKEALSDGHFEAEADAGDFSVTKQPVLNSDPAAIPATASKGEGIAERRLRFETPLLVASKLGEIFV